MAASMKNFKSFLREAAWHQLPNYAIHKNPDADKVKDIVDSDRNKAARFIAHPKSKEVHVAVGSHSLHTDMMNKSGYDDSQKKDAVRGYIHRTYNKGEKGRNYSFETVSDEDPLRLNPKKPSKGEPPPGPLKPHPFYQKLRDAGIRDQNPHRRDESTESNIVIAFCRMNPFTKGHQKLIEKVSYLSRLLNAQHEIILSHSHNKHNPLSLDEKLQFARKFFWPIKFTSSSKEAPTILYHFDRLREEGYKHITVVAGSDRIKGFQDLVDQYEMKDVSVISAGDRTPDELTASKLREAARTGDYATFKKGVPTHLRERDIEDLYLTTRKGLTCEETSAPNKNVMGNWIHGKRDQYGQSVMGGLHNWNIGQPHSKTPQYGPSDAGTGLTDVQLAKWKKSSPEQAPKTHLNQRQFRGSHGLAFPQIDFRHHPDVANRKSQVADLIHKHLDRPGSTNVTKRLQDLVNRAGSGSNRPDVQAVADWRGKRVNPKEHSWSWNDDSVSSRRSSSTHDFGPRTSYKASKPTPVADKAKIKIHDNPTVRTIQNISRDVQPQHDLHSPAGRFIIDAKGDVVFGNADNTIHRNLSSHHYGEETPGEIHGYTYHHPTRGYQYAAWKTNGKYNFNTDKKEHLTGKDHEFLQRLENLGGFHNRPNFTFQE